MKNVGTIRFCDPQNTNNIIFEIQASIDFESAKIIYKDAQVQLNMVWSLMDLVTIESSIKNRIGTYLPFSSNYENNPQGHPGFIHCEDNVYLLSILNDGDFKHIHITDFNRAIFKEFIMTLKNSVINFRYIEVNNIKQENQYVNNMKQNIANNGMQNNMQTGYVKSGHAPDIINGNEIPKNNNTKMDDPKKVLSKSKKKQDKIRDVMNNRDVKRTKAFDI